MEEIQDLLLRDVGPWPVALAHGTIEDCAGGGRALVGSGAAAPLAACPSCRTQGAGLGGPPPRGPNRFAVAFGEPLPRRQNAGQIKIRRRDGSGSPVCVRAPPVAVVGDRHGKTLTKHLLDSCHSTRAVARGFAVQYRPSGQATPLAQDAHSEISTPVPLRYGTGVEIPTWAGQGGSGSGGWGRAVMWVGANDLWVGCGSSLVAVGDGASRVAHRASLDEDHPCCGWLICMEGYGG